MVISVQVGFSTNQIEVKIYIKHSYTVVIYCLDVYNQNPNDYQYSESFDSFYAVRVDIKSFEIV